MSAIATSDAGAPTPAQPGLIRSLNNRVVLDLLIEHGTLSRTDIHTLTGLSKPTVSQLLTRLEQSGLVQQGGLGKTGPGGRAPQLYHVEPTAGYAAALDVKRDHINVRIADITGSIISEQQAGTHGSADGPASALAAIQQCCAAAKVSVDLLDAIVVGLPGSYDVESDTLWYVDHVEGWRGTATGAELQALFPGAAIAIENDVNLAAIAERHALASPTADFFLFWLDEGVGGAIMTGGNLHRGSRGAAGEAAFLYTPGTVQDATSRESGALEQHLGTQALLALAANAGHQADTAASALRALLEDASCAETVTELALRYALALASVIALLDPERLVLGGELARIGGERLLAEVTNGLNSLVLTAPPVSLALASGSPVLDGAMTLSLDTARDRVFTT